RIVAPDETLGDEAAGNHAELAGAEHLAHLRNAHDLFLDLRPQQAGHHLLHVIDGFVDDAVVAHLDAGLLHRIAGAGVGADVEADDERLGGSRELYVGHRDPAEAAGHDLHLHLLGRELGERLAQRLDTALHIALDEYRDDSRLVLAELREDILGTGRLTGELHVTELALAVERHLTRLELALERKKLIAGIRCRGESEHDDRHGRSRLFDRTAVLVEERTHPTEFGAGDDRITQSQRALLDEYGRHHAASLLDARLD